MTQLEALYQMAYDADIYINNFSFSGTKKSACMKYDDYKTIALDKPTIESQTEEKELLAEEIGHYETGGLYMIESAFNKPMERSNRLKYEARAKRWAIKYILPFEEIQKAVDNGCYNHYDAAEYCGVTTEFLHKALEYYELQGLFLSNIEK